MEASPRDIGLKGLTLMQSWKNKSSKLSNYQKLDIIRFFHMDGHTHYNGYPSKGCGNTNLKMKKKIIV
jgi:hypothetical protein